MTTKYIVGFAVVVAAAIAGWFFFRSPSPAVAPSELISGSPSPSVSSSPSKTPVAAAITITSPKAGDTVDSPILVTGRARVFENQFTIRVKDSTGKAISQVVAMTDAKDAGQYGNYSVRIPVPPGVSWDATVEVFDYSAKGDGSFAGYASVPVRMKYTDSMEVYAAFLTGAGGDCTATTLFSREIVRTSQYMLMGLVELLKGPSPSDVQQGASTLIPSGVQIKSFRLAGNTAYVDFDQTLQQGVAGSCRVLGIRAQIENTLKQVMGLTNVVISIDGKTEGILQP